MSVDFSKKILPQIEEIYIQYQLNKNFDDSIKLSIKNFFVEKLNQNNDFFADFAFNIELYESNLNSISKIKKDLIIKFKNEILLSLNPDSFKIKNQNKNLSSNEKIVLSLLQKIYNSQSYKEYGFKENNMFSYFERKRYVTRYVFKNDILKKTYHKDILNLNVLASNEEIYENRINIIKENCFNKSSFITKFNKCFCQTNITFSDLDKIIIGEVEPSKEENRILKVTLTIKEENYIYYLKERTEEYSSCMNLFRDLQHFQDTFANTKKILKRLLKIKE